MRPGARHKETQARPENARLSKSPKRPLTLRDVSEASGVSEMTVSRVLRGLGDVSEATRARVQEAAAGWATSRTASPGRWPRTA